MRKIVRKGIVRLYVFLFSRKIFYGLNLILFKLSIRGMGIMNYENEKVSGERFFLKYLKKSGKLKTGVIFDVGANIGHYSLGIRKGKIDNILYSFEPNPLTFDKLQVNAVIGNFIAIQKGMSDNPGTAIIYDYSKDESSEHASLYKEVFSQIYSSPCKESRIELSTVDLFIVENNINHIALLKIDTEGNELNVLKGAKDALERGVINTIQFEFNEMNVFSKTFMKDIIDLLPNFTLFRLLPNELLPLGNYSPLKYEIFAFQNITAIKNT